eukprot:1587432-Amphidinium_carterae.2
MAFFQGPLWNTVERGDSRELLWGACTPSSGSATVESWPDKGSLRAVLCLAEYWGGAETATLVNAFGMFRSFSNNQAGFALNNGDS